MGKFSRKITRQKTKRKNSTTMKFTYKDIQEAYQRGYRDGELQGFNKAIKEIHRLIIGRIKTIKGIGEKTVEKIVKGLGLEEPAEERKQ